MSHIEGINREGGEIHDEQLDPTTIIATRPFLTHERLAPGKRRRGSRLLADVIIIEPDELAYAVDGHHKLRRDCDAGNTSTRCRVLRSTNPALAQKLERRNHGLVAELPVR